MSDNSPSDNEEEICEKPKPKRVMTEKQAEAFKKAQEIRLKNIEERKKSKHTKVVEKKIEKLEEKKTKLVEKINKPPPHKEESESESETEVVVIKPKPKKKKKIVVVEQDSSSSDEEEEIIQKAKPKKVATQQPQTPIKQVKNLLFY